MIRSFHGRAAERLFDDQDVPRFRSFERAARRKLLLLHRAVSLQDLRVPPGNRLEDLKGDRQGQHSIRINDQWRICFVWRDGDAFDLRSPITTEGAHMVTRRLEPIHPGEILEEDFMRPLGLSANAIAKRIDVPVTRISEMVRGRRGVTADTALRLARFFGTSPELWLGLQAEYDLRVARREIGDSVESRIVPMKRAAGGSDEPGAASRWQVREQRMAYRAPAHGRPARDRRRIRRSS